MIGIDLVKIKRFNNILMKDYKLWSHFFTIKEWKYIFSRPAPHQTIAGIFAAKEAILKSSHLNGLQNIGRIEVNHDKYGAPHVNIDSKIVDVVISIAHDDQYAIAIALNRNEIYNRKTQRTI